VSRSNVAVPQRVFAANLSISVYVNLDREDIFRGESLCETRDARNGRRGPLPANNVLRPVVGHFLASIP